MRHTTVLSSIVTLDPVYFYFDIDERSFLAYARDARARGVALQQGAGDLPVTVTLADARESPRQGRLDFGENRLDTATGTMRIRAVFPNPDGVAAGPVRPDQHPRLAALPRDPDTGRGDRQRPGSGASSSSSIATDRSRPDRSDPGHGSTVTAWRARG